MSSTFYVENNDGKEKMEREPPAVAATAIASASVTVAINNNDKNVSKTADSVSCEEDPLVLPSFVGRSLYDQVFDVVKAQATPNIAAVAARSAVKAVTVGYHSTLNAFKTKTTHFIAAEVLDQIVCHFSLVYRTVFASALEAQATSLIAAEFAKNAVNAVVVFCLDAFSSFIEAGLAPEDAVHAVRDAVHPIDQVYRNVFTDVVAAKITLAAAASGAQAAADAIATVFRDVFNAMRAQATPVFASSAALNAALTCIEVFRIVFSDAIRSGTEPADVAKADQAAAAAVNSVSAVYGRLCCDAFAYELGAGSSEYLATQVAIAACEHAVGIYGLLFAAARHADASASDAATAALNAALTTHHHHRTAYRILKKATATRACDKMLVLQGIDRVIRKYIDTYVVSYGNNLDLDRASLAARAAACVLLVNLVSYNAEGAGHEAKVVAEFV